MTFSLSRSQCGGSVIYPVSVIFSDDTRVDQLLSSLSQRPFVLFLKSFVPFVKLNNTLG